MSRLPNFRQQTLSGLGWSVTAQLGRQALTFTIGVILARLLTPEAFGLIGMVIVFTGFANMFVDMGFGSALIHKQDVTPEHYTSIFWLNVGAGFILMLLFIGVAPLIAHFYDEPALFALTAFLATNFFIGSLGLIQSVQLNKKLDFRRLAIVDLSALVISGGIGITMALMGKGVWSLAVQSVVGTTCTAGVLWMLSSWRPQFTVRWSTIRELLGYSSNLLGFNMINYWSRNADNLLIGRFLGTAALGLYGKAYQVMMLPLSNVSRTIGRVMFPALATIQDDKKRVASVYLRMTRVVALVTFPMMLGLLVVAEHFVIGLFGPQWSGMIPLLRLLCLVGLVQSITTLNGNLYQSQGRTDLQLRVGGTIGVLRIAAIAVGLNWGVVGVATTYTIYSLLVIYPNLHYPVSLIGLTVFDVMKNLAGIFGCAVMMGIAVWMMGKVLPASWPHLGVLTMQTGAGIIIYGVLLRLTGLQAYRESRDLVTEQWQRRFGKLQVTHPG